MDWRAIIGILAGLITFAATVPYIRAAAKGTIRPSVVAWAGGALLNGIAFAAQIVSEPSWSATLAFASIAYCTIIAILAIRYGFQGFSKLDSACIALAVVAIAGWQITNEPLVALVFDIVADIVADIVVCIPMFVKTWRHPESELASRWVICVGSSLLGAFSIRHINIIELAWPVYLVALNALMAALTLRKKSESSPSIS